MTTGSTLKFRRRVHELLEPAKGDERASWIVDTVIGLMIGLAVLSICLESAPELGRAYRSQFIVIETVTVIFLPLNTCFEFGRRRVVRIYRRGYYGAAPLTHPLRRL